MLTKENLIKQIDNFPDEFSLDELVERLIFIEKVERAERQSNHNETVSHEHLDKQIEKWFK